MRADRGISLVIRAPVGSHSVAPVNRCIAFCKFQWASCAVFPDLVFDAPVGKRSAIASVFGPSRPYLVQIGRRTGIRRLP